INAHNMADLPVHTLFLVGHNVGREQPGLLKDVYDLGKKLQGRYLILNSCEHVTAAQSIGWQENRLLLKHTKAAGIYAYHSTIPIAGVSQMFTQLIKLSSQHPELLSGQLIDIAIKRTFATAEAQNDKSTPN
ncbi:MAG: hypothetical protein KC425_00605, partial [Anaerolineales bacterium]|nr:hypothetical protein [Anaerolineales bacterium]